MELLALLITSFIVGFSGAMMPGPLLAVTIAETPRKGVWTGQILTGGHAIAEIAVVVILSLGLVALADNPIVSRGIAMVGGVMLIFMGIGMIFELFKQHRLDNLKDNHVKKSSRLVLDGIVTSLSNPYWFVWWATTGSAFLVKSIKFGAIGPTVFYIGHIMSDLVWYSLVSFLIWKGRKFVSGPGYKILIGSCALFLIYLGGSFLHDGITGTF